MVYRLCVTLLCNFGVGFKVLKKLFVNLAHLDNYVIILFIVLIMHHGENLQI